MMLFTQVAYFVKIIKFDLEFLLSKAVKYVNINFFKFVLFFLGKATFLFTVEKLRKSSKEYP